MKIILLAAISKNQTIGHCNKLLWHLPNDLKRFKKLTLGYPIIMGRKTFESIGKALPKRKNIVITKNKNYSSQQIEISSSLEEALNLAKTYTKEKIFIIGGGQIYTQAISLADILEITLIEEILEGDTKFPKINLKNWKEIERISYQKDELHAYDYIFITYIRTNNKN